MIYGFIKPFFRPAGAETGNLCVSLLQEHVFKLIMNCVKCQDQEEIR